MRSPQPGDRARHPGGLCADQTRVGYELALRVQIHVAGCSRWRYLAVVEEFGTRLGIDQHESTAADIAGFRVGHGQCEGGRNGGIDGVAAALQHGLRGGGAKAVRHRNRSDACCRRTLRR